MTGENVIFLLHRDHVVDEKIFAWFSWGTSPRIFLTLVLYDEVFFRNNKNLMKKVKKKIKKKKIKKFEKWEPKKLIKEKS